MPTTIGNARLYATLCKVLDSLRAEAPSTDAIYNPPAGITDALIHARSRALLHLFLKARFGLVHFGDRESFVTDVSRDGGDLIPSIRTKLSMISDEGKGKKDVEEQAHGSADDRGVEATGGRS
jgi:hypothetical protein